jgi:hypothetical protein
MEEVLMPYREYSDFNIRQFHEKLAEREIDLSYTWASSKEIGDSRVSYGSDWISPNARHSWLDQSNE